MERYIIFAEELLNLPKEESPEALMRVIRAGMIDCALERPLDKIPLRDQLSADTPSNKTETFIKVKSKALRQSNCYREISNGPSPRYKDNKYDDSKDHNGFREVTNTSSSIATEPKANMLSEECPSHSSFRNDITNRPAHSTIPSHVNVYGGAAMVAAYTGAFLKTDLQNISKAVRKQKEKLLTVLSEANITKEINPYVIHEALSAAHRSGCIVIDSSGKKPQLSFTLNSARFPTLEDEFEVKLYLHPLLNGYVHKLFNWRCCENCKKIFFYTLEKAKFCSERCRGAAARKRQSKL